MTLVFVHIPKVAGTSLKRAITEQIGSDNLFCDYNSPMAKAKWHRNAHCLISSYFNRQRLDPVIFGHFQVGKYARFTGSKFIKKPGIRYAIFFRDPLQRAISHYYFWQRTYVGGHRVWERFTRENWSLERFLLSREHVNFQSKFIWRFPIEQFDFIGLADHYHDSLKLLGRVFPILEGLNSKTANRNTEKPGDRAYVIDPGLEADFKRFNEVDYSLYARAEEIFLAAKAPCPEYGGYP
ncbi:MAG: sulfotransferase family 2 domain-containing protein [Methylococcales bacterium]